MREDKAIIDLLAKGLVKQDELVNKVDLLASAMMDFKEIAASQSRSLETIASMIQEQKADIRDIRYEMNTFSNVEEEIDDLPSWKPISNLWNLFSTKDYR